MFGAQETNSWGAGDPCVESKKQIVREPETIGWGPGNQWLVSRRSMLAAAQETISWAQGNQLLGSRKSMVGVPEINAWDPAVLPGG